MKIDATHSNLHDLQVIVGLGKTGLSCAHWLAAHHFNIAVTDSRDNPPGLTELQAQFPLVPVITGHFDTQLCQKASRLIVSPGVSLREPAVAAAIAQGIPAIGDIELFAKAHTAPVIAITGSNGKSTVTTLVGEMARQAGKEVEVGGNLGTPALDLLTSKTTELFVLELSSFQLETTYSLKPAAAVILNLSEDHMDRYDSMTDYLKAKQRIYAGCATTIINRDDPITWQNLTFEKTLSFGLDEPQEGQFGLRNVEGNYYLARGTENLLATSNLKIKGRHQLANALAALALGEAVSLPMPAMLEALKNFQGLTHRCQWVAHYHGVDWYNDSKATNVGAAKPAIEGLGADIQGKLVVIAGGLGKNADFSPLKDTMKKYVRQLILIGKDAPLMANALKGSVNIEQASTMEQAVTLAQQQAQPGDAVILAPACASFDMFNNFEHRGEVFMSAVRALA
ncbi:MAG TPA: UDP-N-acetylmuramoyl-L-alanine--D-glutamate ligase [Gammaproteobacteria bacterium]|nr:UDP-N-acetylmuramoyl-L-alanine--D-glutamate ligase [Gammaproteobacteria bacterium]